VGKNWRKRTAVLHENGTTEIGVCWTCVKRNQRINALLVREGKYLK